MNDRSFLDRHAGTIGAGALGLGGLNALQNTLQNKTMRDNRDTNFNQGTAIKNNASNIRSNDRAIDRNDDDILDLNKNQLIQHDVINNHAGVLKNHGNVLSDQGDEIAFTKEMANNPAGALGKQYVDSIDDLFSAAGDKIVDLIPN